MADLRGLFQNNRRREAQAVVGKLPYSIEPADIREGTDAVVATNEAYTLCTLPDNVIVTGAYLVVETGSEFVAGTCQVAIGGTVVIPALTDLTTAGITASDDAPLLLEGQNDIIITPASLTVDEGNALAETKVVVEYIDYDRATMSYIGED